jgi:hypothetical protein
VEESRRREESVRGIVLESLRRLQRVEEAESEVTEWIEEVAGWDAVDVGYYNQCVALPSSMGTAEWLLVMSVNYAQFKRLHEEGLRTGVTDYGMLAGACDEERWARALRSDRSPQSGVATPLSRAVERVKRRQVLAVVRRMEGRDYRGALAVLRGEVRW